jgi:hypothetical protein
MAIKLLTKETIAKLGNGQWMLYELDHAGFRIDRPEMFKAILAAAFSSVVRYVEPTKDADTLLGVLCDQDVEVARLCKRQSELLQALTDIALLIYPSTGGTLGVIRTIAQNALYPKGKANGD